MKTSSAKAKGRRLQQQVAKAIRDTFGLPESDVKTLPMGSQGCDVWLSAQAQTKFPFGIECKNVEKLNIWQAWQQAKTNATNASGILEVHPIVIFSRNRSDVLCTLEFQTLLNLLNEQNKTKD